MKRNASILKLQTVLLRRREGLRQSLASDLMLLGTHDFEDDLYDDGVVSQLAESESRELEAIEHALERMRNGQCGTCEECGGKIPLTRLQALPYATLCINCQRQTEKSGRTKGRSANWSGVVDVTDDGESTPGNLELLLM